MTISALLGHRGRDRKAPSRTEEGRMAARAERAGGRGPGCVRRAA
jgi:hypothetical protein